jgi:hypothetical protein
MSDDSGGSGGDEDRRPRWTRAEDAIGTASGAPPRPASRTGRRGKNVKRQEDSSDDEEEEFCFAGNASEAKPRAPARRTQPPRRRRAGIRGENVEEAPMTDDAAPDATAFHGRNRRRAAAARRVKSYREASSSSSSSADTESEADDEEEDDDDDVVVVSAATAAAYAAAPAAANSKVPSSPSSSTRRHAQRKIEELRSPRTAAAATTMNSNQQAEGRDPRRRRAQKKDRAHAVGTWVYKAFPPHGTFWGQVYGTRRVRPSKGDADGEDDGSGDDADEEEMLTVYCVAYEDGDREDMTENEMRTAVRSAGRHKPSPSTVASLATVVRKYQRGERVPLDENYHQYNIHNNNTSNPPPANNEEKVVLMDCDEEDEPMNADIIVVNAAGSDSDDSSYATGRAVPRRAALSSPSKKLKKGAATAATAKARAHRSDADEPVSNKRKRPESKKRAASSTTAKRGAVGKRRAGAGKTKNVEGGGNSDDDEGVGKDRGSEDLPVITEPQGMFDDMIQRLARGGSTFSEYILPLLQKLSDRPLRLATMCSGTESPILALDMIQSALKRLFENDPALKRILDEKKVSSVLPMEHVFSCEIEPFKQAYIERNFHPPILFRDIRELKNDKAHTAYGTLVDVPGLGSVDLLVAGTSCVDYSNLNTQRVRTKEAASLHLVIVHCFSLSFEFRAENH